MLHRLSALPRRHPVIFGCALSCAKTGAADVVTQTQLEGKAFPKEWDRRRTAIFASWGFAYLGGVQYWLYSFAFPRMFPGAVAFIERPLRAKLRDTTGLLTLVKQVGFDQLVHHPWILFPAFYAVKETIEGGTLDAAMRKWWSNLRRDCLICWAWWVPAFTVNFSVCPLWMRIPFVATVSFAFTMYFSFIRGAPQAVPEAAEAAASNAVVEVAVTVEEAEEGAESSAAGMTTSDIFHAASEWVQSNPQVVADRMSTSQKLRLYGLFKRVTVGVAPTDEDDYGGGGGMKVRAKRRAWVAASSLTLPKAQREYAALVETELGWRGGVGR